MGPKEKWLHEIMDDWSECLLTVKNEFVSSSLRPNESAVWVRAITNQYKKEQYLNAVD